ncbi:MAG: hypothetical protein M8357_01400 [Desulfobulbaceae bacterium]|nr:hypothetical protein [Desulfobulbaceae bacterium]
MLGLLHKCTRAGYPPDYLVSRIRGRIGAPAARAPITRAGGYTFREDDAAIWDAAAAERQWLYLQMDDRLRKDLAPLLLYGELPTLIRCLRNLEAGRPDAVEVDLAASLLADEVKKIMAIHGPLAEIVGKLERFFVDTALGLHGLAAAYGEGGVHGCEELIRRRYFEQVFIFAGHPEAIWWLRSLIDLRNVMTLAKCVRWKESERSMLIDGGHIGIRKRDQVPSEAGLEKLVRRFVGGGRAPSSDLHPVSLEPLLHDHLSTAMTRRMRSVCPVACCSGYIWHIFASARKRSGEHHAARFAVNFQGQTEGE